MAPSLAAPTASHAPLEKQAKIAAMLAQLRAAGAKEVQAVGVAAQDTAAAAAAAAAVASRAAACVAHALREPGGARHEAPTFSCDFHAAVRQPRVGPTRAAGGEVNAAAATLRRQQLWAALKELHGHIEARYGAECLRRFFRGEWTPALAAYAGAGAGVPAAERAWLAAWGAGASRHDDAAAHEVFRATLRLYFALARDYNWQLAVERPLPPPRPLKIPGPLPPLAEVLLRNLRAAAAAR